MQLLFMLEQNNSNYNKIILKLGKCQYSKNKNKIVLKTSTQGATDSAIKNVSVETPDNTQEADSRMNTKQREWFYKTTFLGVFFVPIIFCMHWNQYKRKISIHTFCGLIIITFLYEENNFSRQKFIKTHLEKCIGFHVKYLYICARFSRCVLKN